jgi:polyisoprenoid-binding protein YceI
MNTYCQRGFMKTACALVLLFLSAYNTGTTQAVDSRPDHQNQGATPVRFRLDSSRSKFIAHALRGGLLWFKGHEHLIAARQFTGEAQVMPGSIALASLQLIVRADSMVETSDEFTEQQKQIINRELREIVLEPEKYPEIIFRSTGVTGRVKNGQYELRVEGDLTLHGVTRRIKIPAKVSLTGNTMRAIGEFSISRNDFKVKATSAFHGLVRVRDKVKFEFEIIGEKI